MSIQQVARQSHDYFSIQHIQYPQHASIKMLFLTKEVNTRDIPATYSYLEKLLPSILRSKCYNNENLPFFEEVKQTELGHLFEHILLEYLCMLKIKKGHKKATYRGKTCWNWKRDPKGTFHITATCGLNDSDIFASALKQSVDLMNVLLRGKKKISNRNYRQTYKQAILRSPVYMITG